MNQAFYLKPMIVFMNSLHVLPTTIKITAIHFKPFFLLLLDKQKILFVESMLTDWTRCAWTNMTRNARIRQKVIGHPFSSILNLHVTRVYHLNSGKFTLFHHALEKNTLWAPPCRHVVKPHHRHRRPNIFPSHRILLKTASPVIL